ncbi:MULTISPECIES: MFS transporter [Empedobacter]|uniref:MFS transporter n=2 Tax=Empedobacter TaxID=59734 RepID=A0A427BJX2_9FLAO|nr:MULTISPECIES: MFS transporter [Empedobacter]MBW1619384.1 sugar MFS transporter [Empedobacter falsenii]MDH0659442.1 MFS transporter [Empedobacter sp. GD03865]MDH0675061.1 MFS transporter [Empedobacter sp. GD03861]MDH1603287.1 MFS transporter [Empedobacter sp. GD03739]MDM1139540.1 MFS transporter [Empedobacter sp. R132-2]
MSQSQKTNWGQFIPLVTVFFFWGFVAASNEILIPVFKKSFDLSQAESQLVAVAYYIAYTVGALIYMGVSLLAKQDLINKFGYKNSLSFGLLLSAIGTLFFIPAANTGSFPLMLTGLFTVGLGFSLQQTVANPLAIALGDASTGSQRLTLAGGINNLGTTIGPLIVAYAIFGAGGEGETTLSIEAVKIPYLCLGVAFLAVAIFLKFSSLPNHPEQEEDSAIATSKNDKSSALKYPQLLLGMLAIFLYVGVEVSTVSNLPAYMHNELGFDIQGVTPYVSLYWASMMIGRWGGAAEAFGLDKTKTLALKFIAPYLAFGIFLLVNYIAGHDLKPFYLYSVIILIMILASLWTNGNPAKMLLTFSIIGIVALLIGMNTTGLVSIYSITSVGLFCSTLWPCIFALAINGLGKNTSQGSNFLIMMIMGGGLVSIFQGYIADLSTVHSSYIVCILCFVYLVFYAIATPKILKKQGINLGEVKSEGGH